MKKDNIQCANNYMSIVLGFLFFTLSCQAHFISFFPVFHTKIQQFEIHPNSLMLVLTVSTQTLINSLFYENIEFLNRSDGLQISVQSYLTKDNTNTFIVVVHGQIAAAT